jgi:hypothetical protein
MHRLVLGAWVATIAVLMATAPAGAAARPDLAVSRVTAAGVTVDPGSCGAAGCTVRLAAAARVVNRGRARARRARLWFFLSQDARRNRGDKAAPQRLWLPAIRRGRRRSSESALALTGIAPGVYRLLACADATGLVRERSERNNCRASRPFTVQAAPGAALPAPAAPQQPAGACTEPGWRTDLCREVTTAMRNRMFSDMADALTFALLYQHHRTGQAIAPSIAAAVIEPFRTGWDPVRGQAGLASYRVSGFLDFWAYGSYAGVDWARYPAALDTQQEFADWWETYGIVQFTARQNAINHRLNAIVESEAAWREAMDDLKAHDQQIITAQQYSDATVFAHRTLEDARTAVDAAENAIKGPP